MESPKCSKLVHMIAAFFYCRKMFSFEQSDIKSCVLRYSTVVFLFIYLFKNTDFQPVEGSARLTV